MSRGRAIAGSLVFLLVAPGVVVGLVPWLLTGWAADPWWPPLRVMGGAMIGVGLVVLLEAFVRFALQGSGTPAPVAPTKRLVVRGAYRYVRNPMYLAVGALSPAPGGSVFDRRRWSSIQAAPTPAGGVCAYRRGGDRRGSPPWYSGEPGPGATDRSALHPLG